MISVRLRPSVEMLNSNTGEADTASFRKVKLFENAKCLFSSASVAVRRVCMFAKTCVLL